jgi:hypothetical protein
LEIQKMEKVKETTRRKTKLRNRLKLRKKWKRRKYYCITIHVNQENVHRSLRKFDKFLIT